MPSTILPGNKEARPSAGALGGSVDGSEVMVPRRAKEMSAVEVKRLTTPGLHAVGGVAGLSLQVKPTGARSWILRTRIAGRRVELGLGPVPDVTLSMARENARAIADRARKGEGEALLAERRAARTRERARTFADAAEEWLKVKLVEIEGEKNRLRYRSVLDRYALPRLGEMKVGEIALTDVADALRPIWTTKTETATKVRERMEAIFAYAIAHGWRTNANPAMWKGGLSAMLAAPSKVARSSKQPAFAIDVAPLWYAALRQREGTSAQALELLALTAVRSGELRGMCWGEVDLEARLWTVPAERMKMKREHRVPLSPSAVDLLKALRPDEPASDALVLAAPRGGPLSDMALSMAMRRMHEARVEAGEPGWVDPKSGRPAVPHGLRSTFRSWAAEKTDVPREVAELCLAHEVGSTVELAYQRSEMVERRRVLMEGWASWLAGKAGHGIKGSS